MDKGTGNNVFGGSSSGRIKGSIRGYLDTWTFSKVIRDAIRLHSIMPY